MHFLNEHNILLFLVQVFLLLGLARGMGLIFARWKQPTITAEILAGVLLGPTVLGRLFPGLHGLIFPPDLVQQNMLETVAWIGVLFLLLETGLEFDFSSAWRQRGDALKIAVTDIVIPIALSFGLAMFLPARYMIDPSQRFVFALFLATAMTISAMPVTAKTLHDLNMSKTDMGFLIISALSVNDILGWIIFTLVLGLFTNVSPSVGGILTVTAATLAFAALCLSAGRNVVNTIMSEMRTRRAIQPAHTLTFICLLGLLCGAVTQLIGIHALFGFFLAGIMAGGARAIPEKTRAAVSQMVFAIFVPLFFASIGLKVDFLKNFDLLIVLFVTLISIGGKFAGAWIAVGFTRIPRANRLAIAVAHTPGGTMEIVVGLLAFQYGLITEPVFEAIVFGGVISAMLLGPWLKYSVRQRKVISVLEFFSREGVKADLHGDDRNGIISELCELAGASNEAIDVENVYNAVMKREEAMGTALENGIAVPHARLTWLDRPLVVFGRSRAGIDWDSPDGQMTQLIFLILTPQDDADAQLTILRSIAETMSEKSTRDAIMDAAGDDEVWAILHRVFAPHRVVKNGGKEGKK